MLRGPSGLPGLLGRSTRQYCGSTTSGTRLLATIRPCAHHHLGPQSCFGSLKTCGRFSYVYSVNVCKTGPMVWGAKSRCVIASANLAVALAVRKWLVVRIGMCDTDTFDMPGAALLRLGLRREAPRICCCSGCLWGLWGLGAGLGGTSAEIRRKGGAGRSKSKRKPRKQEKLQQKQKGSPDLGPRVVRRGFERGLLHPGPRGLPPPRAPRGGSTPSPHRVPYPHAPCPL
jgi:hypothetical protein